MSQWFTPLACIIKSKVMAFIKDRHATKDKEPNPVCLPTAKSWEWHTDNAINVVDRFEAYYSNTTPHGA
jgi:hypothetical protein